MKNYLLIISLVGLAAAKADWNDEARQRESQQASMWEENIEKSANYTPEDKLSYLSMGLKNIGYRRDMEGHSPEVDKVYIALQKIFLATPGHAKYFADSLTEQREALEHGDSRGVYNFKRNYIIRETLVHLPSPETVQVLGGYLFDDSDDPPERLGPRPDATPIHGNGRLAAGALANIGLRDPPVKTWSESYDVDAENALKGYQAWWVRVKAGEIPFSFVGQAVEYRFQADGSVVSSPIEIPKEELARAEASIREQRRPKNVSDGGSKVSEAPNPSSRMHYWIWGVAGFLMAIILIGFSKTKK